MNFVASIKNIFNKIYLSFKRFPLTILISISVAILLVIISETTPTSNTLNRFAMILALSIPLSLCIKFFFEKKESFSTYKLVVGYTIGALFLVFYYFVFLKDTNMISLTRYIAISIALYLSFLFTPYSIEKDEFEMYVITVLTGFFVTLFYSIVLYFGLSAILFTINKLLTIQIPSKIYYYTGLLVVFGFAVSYFLSNIPSKNGEEIRKSYPKFLKILLLYIVAPLSIAYTIILYIYFGKIIITTKWPIGLVSHLVLWYSLVVITLLFFITPIKNQIISINKSLRIVPSIIIPLLVMMFFSIGIRINAYGITEKRYYAIVLAIWICSIMLYFIFTKKTKNIILPITLSIVVLISSFGPLSSYSISKISQNNRFEKILLRNNMIKGGNLQPSSNISIIDQEEISNILNYFNKYHSLKEVSYLPKDFKLDDMDKILGFSFRAPNYGYQDNFFNFTRDYSEKTIDINGYDYLIDMRNINNEDNKLSLPLNVSYNYDLSNIKIIHEKNVVYNKNLNSFAKILTNKYGIVSNKLNPNEMELVEENDKIKVKFVFSNISGNKNTPNSDIHINGLDFYLLIKIK